MASPGVHTRPTTLPSLAATTHGNSGYRACRRAVRACWRRTRSTSPSQNDFGLRSEYRLTPGPVPHSDTAEHRKQQAVSWKESSHDGGWDLGVGMRVPLRVQLDDERHRMSERVDEVYRSEDRLRSGHRRVPRANNWVVRWALRLAASYAASVQSLRTESATLRAAIH